jgi:hypothetical protein
MKQLLVALVGVIALTGGASASASQASLYTDASAARRVGYTPQSITGAVEHWVNVAYHRDGRELDLDRPEALMYVRDASGLHLVAEVFVLDHVGETPPAVGGEAWHHHSACLGEGGLGVPLPGAPCPAGTALVDTPPMLHVWVDGSERVLDNATFCRLKR